MKHNQIIIYRNNININICGKASRQVIKCKLFKIKEEISRQQSV